jgi:hypothetical protein
MQFSLTVPSTHNLLFVALNVEQAVPPTSTHHPAGTSKGKGSVQTYSCALCASLHEVAASRNVQLLVMSALA